MGGAGAGSLAWMTRESGATLTMREQPLQRIFLPASAWRSGYRVWQYGHVKVI
jgi:hypothetical protein